MLLLYQLFDITVTSPIYCEVKEDGMKRVMLSVRSFERYKRQFELLCREEGRTMNDVITSLMQKWIDERSQEVTYLLGAKWIRRGKEAIWLLAIQDGTAGDVKVVDSGTDEVSTIKELKHRISDSLGGREVFMLPGSDNGEA
jgi:hypothetical protein